MTLQEEYDQLRARVRHALFYGDRHEDGSITIADDDVGGLLFLTLETTKDWKEQLAEQALRGGLTRADAKSMEKLLDNCQCYGCRAMVILQAMEKEGKA